MEPHDVACLQVVENPQELASRPSTPLSQRDASVQSSTYSHVSAPGSPVSYHFSPSYAEESYDSDWGSDNEVGQPLHAIANQQKTKLPQKSGPLKPISPLITPVDCTSNPPLLRSEE
jgi:hypothetical protein